MPNYLINSDNKEMVEGLAKNTFAPGNVTPISHGGTGASTAAGARANLGLPDPLPIDAGGTGAQTAEEARANLGFPDPIPVNKGGTGATTAAGARSNLGAASSSHTHQLSSLGGTLPIDKGGTGATTAADARANLGIVSPVDFPIAVNKGGTGATTAAGARTNLGLDGILSFDTLWTNSGSSMPSGNSISIPSLSNYNYVVIIYSCKISAPGSVYARSQKAIYNPGKTGYYYLDLNYIESQLGGGSPANPGTIVKITNLDAIISYTSKTITWNTEYTSTIDTGDSDMSGTTSNNIVINYVLGANI